MNRRSNTYTQIHDNGCRLYVAKNVICKCTAKNIVLINSLSMLVQYVYAFHSFEIDIGSVPGLVFKDIR